MPICVGRLKLGDFIHRALEVPLKKMIDWFPVVSITGPRQSGKSTLAKKAFPDYSYINLEDPQTRTAALEDPISFIRNKNSHLIIDEAQYAPELFSVIQTVSDERNEPGQYILTGSQNFLMMKNISQSLAGRVGLLKLLPLSYKELQDSESHVIDVDEFAFSGGYPRLHDLNIPPSVYYPSYIDTYVERDITGLLDIRNKASFRKLLFICAQNAGNLLNIASLSREAGVTVPTIKEWLSILEASYIIYMVQPYHANTRKRLTKTPKLYFYDTGLLCSLLNINDVSHLLDSPFLGMVFENFVITEILKKHLGQGKQPDLYFYRDDSKREIDLLDLTDPNKHQAIEIKSSRVYHDKYARHLRTVCDELDIDKDERFVVARVESSYKTKDCDVVSVRDWLLQ